MRRVVSGAAGLLAAATAASMAHASPYTITAEAGVEYDTNVERVETNETTPDQQPIDPVTAAVSRFGGRVVHRDHLLGGTYALDLSALARVVTVSTQPMGSVADAEEANVGTLSADARWLHPLGERPVSAGVALTATDAIALCDCLGDRTYYNLGVDGLLAMRGDEDRHLTLAAGVRDFRYKPAPQFSWTGPTASARLDVVLSANADHTRTVELATTAGVDIRSYNDTALVYAPCPSGQEGMTCVSATTFTRRDRYEHVGADLTFVGRHIFALGYQLGAIESNSYGQSLIRHRVSASATSELPWELFGTIIGTLQFDQYPDGLVVLVAETDQLRNLEDESRSSLQIRLARHLGEEWSLELRAAVWRNLGDTQGDDFHRTLVSLGVVYNGEK